MTKNSFPCIVEVKANYKLRDAYFGLAMYVSNLNGFVKVRDKVDAYVFNSPGEAKKAIKTFLPLERNSMRILWVNR